MHRRFGIQADALVLGLDYEFRRNVIFPTSATYENDEVPWPAAQRRGLRHLRGLRYPAQSIRHDLAASTGYTQRDSNIPIDSYSKHQVGLNRLAARFPDFPPLLPLSSGGMPPSTRCRHRGGLFDLREIVTASCGAGCCRSCWAPAHCSFLARPAVASRSSRRCSPRRRPSAIDRAPHGGTPDLNTQPLQSSYGTDDASIESQVLLIRWKSPSCSASSTTSSCTPIRNSIPPPPGWFADGSRGCSRRSPRRRSSKAAKADAAIRSVAEGRIKVVRQRTRRLADVGKRARATRAGKAVRPSPTPSRSRISWSRSASRHRRDLRVARQVVQPPAPESSRTSVLAADKAVEDFRAAQQPDGRPGSDRQRSAAISDVNNELIEARAEASDAARQVRAGAADRQERGRAPARSRKRSPPTWSRGCMRNTPSSPGFVRGAVDQARPAASPGRGGAGSCTRRPAASSTAKCSASCRHAGTATRSRPRAAAFAERAYRWPAGRVDEVPRPSPDTGCASSSAGSGREPRALQGPSSHATRKRAGAAVLGAAPEATASSTHGGRSGCRPSFPKTFLMLALYLADKPPTGAQ